MARPALDISIDWQEIDDEGNFFIASQPMDDVQGEPVTTPSPTGAAVVEPSPTFTLPIRGLRPENVGPPSDDDIPMPEAKDELPAAETVGSTSPTFPILAKKFTRAIAAETVGSTSPELPMWGKKFTLARDSSTSPALPIWAKKSTRATERALLDKWAEMTQFCRDLGDLGDWVNSCRSHAARYISGQAILGLTFKPQEPRDLFDLFQHLYSLLHTLRSISDCPSGVSHLPGRLDRRLVASNINWYDFSQLHPKEYCSLVRNVPELAHQVREISQMLASHNAVKYDLLLADQALELSWQELSLFYMVISALVQLFWPYPYKSERHRSLYQADWHLRSHS